MLIKGSLSNDNGDAEDDAESKMNLHFTNEIRTCLDLFSTPMALKIHWLNMQWQRSILNWNKRNYPLSFAFLRLHLILKLQSEFLKFLTNIRAILLLFFFVLSLAKPTDIISSHRNSTKDNRTIGKDSVSLMVVLMFFAWVRDFWICVISYCYNQDRLLSNRKLFKLIYSQEIYVKVLFSR